MVGASAEDIRLLAEVTRQVTVAQNRFPAIVLHEKDDGGNLFMDGRV